MKQRFFEAAKKESYLSDYNGPHIGAVAVYRDKFILARAHNSAKTNPTQYFYNKYRISGNKSTIMTTPPRSHCETNLWRKIKFLDIDFKDVTIYLYREHKDGKIALSAPCYSCAQLLKDCGIETVCYTASDGYVEKKFFKQQ